MRRIITVALLVVLPVGCAGAPYTWAKDIPADRARPAEQSKKIQRGDTIDVSVVGQETMSAEHTVGADGTIALPNAGSVLLAGRSNEEAAQAIKKGLSRILSAPDVSVVVIARHIEVGLLGEVRSPGKYLLKSGDGVASALAASGGMTEFANENGIYLVRESEPNRIRFRMKDLVRGGKSARAFALRDGDLLVVE